MARARVGSAIADVLLTMGIVMCIPLVILAVGIPIAGVMWLLLQVGRFF